MIDKYSPILFVLFVLGISVFKRLEARHRIRQDPTLLQPLNRLYAGFAFWASLPFLFMAVGIWTGNVNGIFDYLSIDTTNIYILGLALLIFLEDVLLIFWVFFLRGAEKISLFWELAHDRPRIRVAVRFFALALPFIHVWSLVGFER